jgi:ATP-dependent protease ClpP protease subunit
VILVKKMIRVSINKEISRHWGISETDISEQLKAATPGEEIEILINSPGGEVYEGIAIFNLIRDYAKSHNIIIRINGLAASMASYIAIAARTVDKNSKIIVSENSIFLIHNPWNIIMGDYRELAKASEYLERLAAMSGSTYSYVSGKTEKETRALMDAETYFVGNEIIENGFANEFEQINKTDEAFESDRNALIINAKLRIEKTIEKMRATAKADLEKAAALITETFLPPKTPGGLGKSVERTAPGSAEGGVHFENLTAGTGEIPAGTEGGKMTKEELKAKYPELYAAIYAEGREEGIGKERERVEAHLKLGEDSGSMKISAQFIREGKSVMEDKVQAEYLSARMNKSALNAREQDNPPPLNALGGGGADGDAALEAAWNNGMAGKDTQGVRL